MTEVEKDSTSGIEEVSLEEARDVVAEWVESRGRNILDDYIRIDRTWIRPNPWNPNRQDEYMYAHQLEVMRQAGQVAPIIVREVGPDQPEGHGKTVEEHYQIIDGEHRWKATGDLGWKSISVNNLGQVPDSVAMMITVIMNHIKGESDALELGRIFKTLRDQAAGDRKRIERMTRWMPFREREVDVLVDLVRKDRLDTELPTKKPKESSDAWVTFRFRLARDAAAVCTRALEAVIAVASCSTDRAFELICADYLAGMSEEQRQHVDNVKAEETEPEEWSAV